MSTVAASPPPPGFGRVLARRLVQILALQAVGAALLFGGAGRLRWAAGGAYLGMTLAGLAVLGGLVARRNPEVVVARSRLREGTKPFDKAVLAVCSLFCLAVPLVAGLDAVRFGWAPLPGWTFWPGSALFLLSFLPLGAVLLENPYLEQTVRIQRDRGHRVVTTGPYAVVRHPMYAAMILSYAATPLLLGSGWAFAPAAGAVATIVVRTALEDATLRRELEGYEAYARRTRFRLVPFVW